MGFQRKLKKQLFSGLFFQVGFQIDRIAGKKLTATPAAGIYMVSANSRLSASAGTHSPWRFENVSQRARVRRGWVGLLANFQNNMDFFVSPDDSEKNTNEKQKYIL